MSVVNITNIEVLNNPSLFSDPFQFEITFECIANLQEGIGMFNFLDLEWKIVYVGSAEDEKYDQILDCIMVGPVPIGINKFVFQSNGPNPNLIPANDIIGVTVVLLICSYREQEFVRVGYYVNNEYDCEEMKLEPPREPIFEKIQRNILADKPRVTRFPIKWDNILDEQGPPPQINEDELESDINENDVLSSMIESMIDVPPVSIFSKDITAINNATTNNENVSSN